MKIEFTNEALKKIFYSKKYSLPTGLDKTTVDNFEWNLDEFIETSLNKINNNSYKFTSLKPYYTNGRITYIPTIRDRLTIEVLKHKLKSKYRVCPSNRNEITQTLHNILSEEIDYYVVRIDIKKFFPSVPIGNLLHNIERNSLLSYKEYNLLSKLLTNNDLGLIQGLSISNYLAEIYLENFDRDFDVIHKQKIYYNRYVDDIILIITGKQTKNDIKIITEKIDICFNKVQLEINNSKYCHTVFHSESNSQPFEYLGYKFWREQKKGIIKLKCEISDEKIQKYYNRINRIFCLFYNDENSELLYLRIQALYFDHKIARTNLYLNRNDELSYFTYKVRYGLKKNYQYAGIESFNKISKFISRKMASMKFKKKIKRKYKNLIYFTINTNKSNGMIDYSKIPMPILRRIVYRNVFKDQSNVNYHRFLTFKKHELINYYYRLINC